MEKLLICENALCRFLLDLRYAGKDVAQTSLVTGGCPECGNGWSKVCPVCSEALSVSWKAHHPFCASCQSPLQPQKSRAQSRAA